ncbi:TSYL2 protein, partial [Cephalopterus ornatus]|nr:TSYL2 protein [Cephalopterus ornatus]
VETHKEGMETPKEGMETPVKGTETPKEAMETPVKGVETHKEGMETPKEGMETPVKGTEIPGNEKKTPKDEMETPKDGLESTMDPRVDLETTVTPCLEQENGGLETTREATGSLETTVSHCLGQENGGLETPLESKGSPETTREVPGTTNGRRGSLETAVSRCLEQGRRSKEGLETTSKAQGGLESDVPPTSSSLKTTSRRKAGLKTPGRVKGSVGTAGPQCLDRGRSRNGDLETPREGMETTIRPEGSLETTEAEESAVISVGEEEEEEEEDEEEGDEGPGRYLAALEAVQLQLEAVEEFGQSRPGCRIRFFFSVNPYFQNDVVAKEFVRGPSGHLVSHSTPIRWWQGQDPRSRPHKGPPGPRSFFAWFGDHSFPAGDRVAEVSPVLPVTLPSGEDCVVIEDDDEDVQEIPDDGDG